MDAFEGLVAYAAGPYAILQGQSITLSGQGASDATGHSTFTTASVRIAPLLADVDPRASGGANDGIGWANAFEPLRRPRRRPPRPDPPRRHRHLPIQPYVLKLLNEQSAGGMEDRVLPAVPDIKTLKKDLGRAGFDMTNAAGERLDFHGLRHTFTTWLDRTECSRATRKRLTRHAGDDVTDGYAHAELAEMLDALNALPSPLLVEADAAQATGTDGTDPRRSHGGHGSGSEGQAEARSGTAKTLGSARAIPMQSIKLVAAGHSLTRPDLIGQTSGDILSKPRPSTQVGYGESAKTRGNSGVFEGVDHQLDHGNRALLVDDDLRAVVDAWSNLPADVRKMIVGVVKLTPKAQR